MATAVVQPDINVTGFVSKTRKALINGKWVEAASGKTFPTYNPAPAKCSPTSPRATKKISTVP